MEEVNKLIEDLKKKTDGLQKKIDILSVPKSERFDYPTITVCIPTYNSVHTIYWCLWALKKQNIKPKVLVFDNGSTDGTPEALEMAIKNEVFKPLDVTFKRIGRIPNAGIEQNLPFVRNKLAQAVETEYTFSLDSDVILSPNTIPPMIEIMEKKPLLGMLNITHDAINNKHEGMAATLFRTEAYKKVKFQMTKEVCECHFTQDQILAMGYETAKMNTLMARHLLAV